uniref:hypothetical protein n=1 Tax=Loktanella salsilacus TaxID=195913 RepID=UPI003736C2DD
SCLRMVLLKFDRLVIPKLAIMSSNSSASSGCSSLNAFSMAMASATLPRAAEGSDVHLVTLQPGKTVGNAARIPEALEAMM